MAKNLLKLNDNHILFVKEYINNGNNAAAAYRKVYKVEDQKKSSRRGHQLATDPLIKEEILRQQQEVQRKFEEDTRLETIIKKHIDISNSNFLDYYTLETYKETILNEVGEEVEVNKTRYILKDLDSLTIEQQKNIKQIKMTKYGPEITLYDKVTSLQEICRLLGLYENTLSVDTRIDTSSLKNLSTEDLKKLLNN